MVLLSVAPVSAWRLDGQEVVEIEFGHGLELATQLAFRSGSGKLRDRRSDRLPGSLTQQQVVPVLAVDGRPDPADPTVLAAQDGSRFVTGPVSVVAAVNPL